jgi:ketosteroid isomerase-like protein
VNKLNFVAILLLLGCNAAASVQANDAITTAPQDTADIQHLMDTYHHAVAAHDGKTVSSLFLDHGSTWVTVLSDKAFAAMKAKNPAVNKIKVSSYQDFVAFLAKNQSAIDPRHQDVQIMSDGAVASVYFHFDFVIDGKVENRGDETWQLVKTADGWRIVAITYSSNPGAA